MTEPQSVALIREALEAGPTCEQWIAKELAFGKGWALLRFVTLNGTRTHRLDEWGAFPEATAKMIAACNPSAIAEVLQHVAALSAQVRELEERAAGNAVLVPADKLADMQADALRYRTWLAYAFSEEEGTETFLIDTPEKMQEWLDKRAAARREK